MPKAPKDSENLKEGISKPGPNSGSTWTDRSLDGAVRGLDGLEISA